MVTPSEYAALIQRNDAIGAGVLRPSGSKPQDDALDRRQRTAGFSDSRDEPINSAQPHERQLEPEHVPEAEPSIYLRQNRLWSPIFRKPTSLTMQGPAFNLCGL